MPRKANDEVLIVSQRIVDWFIEKCPDPEVRTEFERWQEEDDIIIVGVPSPANPNIKTITPATLGNSPRFSTWGKVRTYYIG
jgi:hypothetical protein